MPKRKQVSTETTAAPVAPSPAPAPEFLRSRGVEATFGLKRGTLYNLEADGKVKGVLLRCRGSKSGVKIWSVDSIRAFIAGEMKAAR